MADDKPAAPVKETPAAATPAPTPPAAKTDPSAGIKAWVRRELALAASGASHEEREKLNP